MRSPNAFVGLLVIGMVSCLAACGGNRDADPADSGTDAGTDMDSGADSSTDTGADGSADTDTDTDGDTDGDSDTDSDSDTDIDAGTDIDASMDWVAIPVSPSTTFTMGSPVEEPWRNTDETQHEVTLTVDFKITAYEVTQAQYVAVVGWNPSYFGPNGLGANCGATCPVENISWFDAVAYANLLSAGEGLPPCYVLSNITCQDSTSAGTDVMACMNVTQRGIMTAKVVVNGAMPQTCAGYRLPTESEWEYAARAGSQTAFPPSPGNDGSITQIKCAPVDPNLDQIAEYCGNNGDGPRPVGGKEPNAWGLYDTSGNIWEWVWDRYGVYPATATDPSGPAKGLDRVIRGGSWRVPARDCRSGRRQPLATEAVLADNGLRLARSIP